MRVSLIRKTELVNQRHGESQGLEGQMRKELQCSRLEPDDRVFSEVGIVTQGNG